MSFGVTATTLLVEDLVNGLLFTIGPFEDEQEQLIEANQVLAQLRPLDTVFRPIDVNTEQANGLSSDFKECYLVATNSDNQVTVSVCELDHMERLADDASSETEENV